MTAIPPASNAAFTRFVMGHFAGGHGDHYLVLQLDIIQELSFAEAKAKERGHEEDIDESFHES